MSTGKFLLLVLSFSFPRRTTPYWGFLCNFRKKSGEGGTPVARGKRKASTPSRNASRISKTKPVNEDDFGENEEVEAEAEAERFSSRAETAGRGGDGYVLSPGVESDNTLLEAVNRNAALQTVVADWVSLIFLFFFFLFSLAADFFFMGNLSVFLFIFCRCPACCMVVFHLTSWLPIQTVDITKQKTITPRPYEHNQTVLR